MVLAGFHHSIQPHQPCLVGRKKTENYTKRKNEYREKEEQNPIKQQENNRKEMSKIVKCKLMKSALS